jgi:hypothetical protein
MIIAKFSGQLGNELFIYTFLKDTSKKVGETIVIDSQKIKISEYFYLNNPFWNIINRIKLFWYYRVLSRFQSYKIVKDFQNGQHTQIGNAYYLGYFQSNKYFSENKDEIIRTYRIKKKYRNFFQKNFSLLKKDYIAIHYRCGDYKNFGNENLGGQNLVLPDSYFTKSIELLYQNGCPRDIPIIIVTDSPNELLEKTFASNAEIISKDEIFDFQVLQHSKYLIISNSSFSWWAASLNRNKILCIAPKYWLGFKVEKEFPPGILNKDWITV